MNILDILKGAKPFLSHGGTREGGIREDSSGKSWCICYAITDYLVQVYGVDAVIYGEKVGLRYKAHRHIESKLQELVETPSNYFSKAHAEVVLGDEYDASSYDYVQEQRARHKWLNQLIKELE